MGGRSGVSSLTAICKFAYVWAVPKCLESFPVKSNTAQESAVQHGSDWNGHRLDREEFSSRRGFLDTPEQMSDQTPPCPTSNGPHGRRLGKFAASQNSSIRICVIDPGTKKSVLRLIPFIHRKIRAGVRGPTVRENFATSLRGFPPFPERKRARDGNKRHRRDHPRHWQRESSV